MIEEKDFSWMPSIEIYGGVAMVYEGIGRYPAVITLETARIRLQNLESQRHMFATEEAYTKRHDLAVTILAMLEKANAELD